LKPLIEKFQDLSDLLLNHRDGLAIGTGVPFIRLVYRPSEERECRRVTQDLVGRLRQNGLTANEIRCGELLFGYYQRKNQLELRLRTAESAPQQAGDEIGHRAESELLNAILSIARNSGPDGNIIISETGLLYPFAHLAGVLASCENQVQIPLVLLYPAEVIDERLLFMGRRETGYYRCRDLV
jgi:hypothetical protein